MTVERVWVSPNPTTGKISVHWNGTMQNPHILITDLYGRQVMDVALNNIVSQQYIDLSNQQPGIYYYQFYLNGRNINNGKIELLR